MVAYSDSVFDQFSRNEGAWWQPHSGWEAAYPHNEGVNIVFCDGHTERLQRKQFSNPTETFWRRWNRDDEPHTETWREGIP